MTSKIPPDIIYKYSKSSAFYLNTKREFFSENTTLLEKASQQNMLYGSQPARTRCKLCQKELPRAADFTSHGIGYTFCSECSHLNGNFEDTKAFIEKLYIADAGRDYSNSYIDTNFVKRTTDIYVPKVDFLIDSIPLQRHRILDVGCGSGYFVYAALLRDLAAAGVDVSRSMVDFGNHQISHFARQSPLACVDEQGFYDSIVQSQADIISAIGVIEHLREPHKFFEALKKSRAVYLYYSVPMFSLSVILENIFPEVFPRQLSGGHTHLFTEASIQKMNALIGVRSVAEWRFGTDVMDLYRSLTISLQKNNVSQKLLENFVRSFAAQIDGMQSVLDKSHYCSEIHCVVAKL